MSTPSPTAVTPASPSPSVASTGSAAAANATTSTSTGAAPATPVSNGLSTPSSNGSSPSTGGAGAGAAASATTTAPGSIIHKSVLIIGGGPCGLGAAWRLEELKREGHPGFDWALVDQATSAGGLASSVVDPQGFVWDMGGHVIFSHYAYFTRLLDHLLPAHEWNQKQREAWVWMRDRFIPYPFQQNIHRLPEKDIIPCLEGLIDVERRRHTFPKPATFQDWLLQSFGRGLCEVFMFPYNRKVWAYNADQMNVEWMGERVATVDTCKILKNLVMQQDELGWGPNSTFRFPMHGGTGTIWHRLYESLPSERFLFNKKAIAVDADKKIVSFGDGTAISYDHLISTMPLDILCRITVNTSIPREELLLRSTQFRYSSSHIIGFGIEGAPPKELATKCWLYFPEDNCPFYRATVFSNYSPYNVPRPGQQWSLMCEVAESPQKPVDKDKILAIAEQGALNCKLFSPEDVIVSRFHIRLEYGYPTPFAGRDQLCAPLFSMFEQHSIFSRGRFGTWKYEVSNQDHSLMLGVEVIDRIAFGTEEMTMKHPGIVNAGRDNSGRVPYIPKQQVEETAAKNKKSAAAAVAAPGTPASTVSVTSMKD